MAEDRELVLTQPGGEELTVHYVVHLPCGQAPDDVASDDGAPDDVASDGAGPSRATVLIHGFRGDHHGLGLIARRLPGPVIVPDLPGFGRTGELAHAHDLTGFTWFLDAFLRALDLSAKPVLVGHSFGTIVCASYAARRSAAISRLVLINPISAAPTQGPRRLASAVAVGYYRLGAALPEAAGRAVLASRIGNEAMSLAMTKTHDPRLRRFIREQHNAYFSAFGSRARLLEAFTTSVTRQVTGFAPRITAPTLLIAGELDDLATVRDQQRLAAAMPDARLVVIEGTGHLTHYEAPAKVARAIREFTS